VVWHNGASEVPSYTRETEAPVSSRKRLWTAWIITSMPGVMGGFTDKYCPACQSSNDRLQPRSNWLATCFPDLGHSDYESAYILGLSAENFATSGGRVFETVAIFVCYSLSIYRKNLQV